MAPGSPAYVFSHFQIVNCFLDCGADISPTSCDGTPRNPLLQHDLAPEGLSPAIVGAIVAHARARNAERGITGLLVFDGYRFCQHFEGPRHATVKLMDRIGEDPRHTHVRVVYEGPLARRRYQRASRWAWTDADDHEGFPDLAQLDGVDALARFLAPAARPSTSPGEA